MMGVVRWLARKFWLLTVILVILLAILVQTGRMLSPHVERYRPQISALLSERLGAPVAMDRISLRWEALEVALQLDGLRLGEKGEVRMGYGLFHLDLLASLWNRELVWKNLQVHDFAAQLNRVGRGNWHVEGFPYTPPAGGDEVASAGERLGDPARIFQLGPKVEVRNASITLRLASGQQAQVKLPQILLENGGGFHRLSARAFIADAGAGAPAIPGTGIETLRLILEGRGDPRDREQFSLKGYIQLNELQVNEDTVALLQQLTPLPERYHWQGKKLARGNLWLRSDTDHGYSLRGRLDLARLEAAKPEPAASVQEAQPATAAGEEPAAGDAAAIEVAAREPEAGEEELRALAPLRSLGGDISGHWLPGGQWRLALQDIELDWREVAMPALNIQASGGDDAGVELSLDRVELRAWSQILTRLQLLPEKADEWLGALQPQGALENLRFGRDGGGTVSLRANLRNVRAAAHLGAPAVEGLDGFLQMHGSAGELQLGGDGDFSIHFPKLYQEPFRLERARGTVAWHVDRENNSVQVNSGALQLEGEMGAVRGQFLLELPFVPFSRAAELTLALGLRESPAAAQATLVPYTVSDNLRDWLGSAIGEDNPGRVTRAGFLYRGYAYGDGEDPALLALGERPERQTVQLSAELTGARLDYLPGWPEASGVDARLVLNDSHVVVNAHRARLWDIAARDLEVEVSPNRAGQGALLEVRASLAGPAGDALRLLRETPLREQLGDGFDDWRLKGSLSGNLTLSQPLAGADVEPHQNVDLALVDGDLHMADTRLAIQSLSGKVHYDSEEGLEGTALSGSLWGRPLTATIRHEGTGEQRDTQVVVRGRSTTQALREWTGRPELAWLDGEFGHRTLVTIPARSKDMPYRAVVEVTSDLAGVAVNLPAPLGKAAEESTDFVLRVPIGEQGSLYNLQYGEHLAGRFWKVGDTLERAAIALNAEPTLPRERGLAISGDVSQVDFPHWRRLLQIYETAPTNPADAFAAEGLASGAGTSGQASAENGVSAATQGPLPVMLDLSTDLLILGKTEIDHIHVRGRGLGSDWELDFDSETAAGHLSGVLNAETPLQLELSHLRLPASEKAEEDETGVESSPAQSPPVQDPWAGFDFADLPQLNFSTDKLYVGDEDFGRWSFNVRPSVERLVISDIRGAARGVRVEGRGQGDNRLGAQLMWMRDSDGSESSQFIGRLSAGDLAAVQRAWGQEPVIESEAASFDTALRWDGSPARVAADVLTGELKIDIRDGRFLRASDNAGSALLRLLSLFNFDTWARRLRLDFSDLYQSGMAFDRVRGEVFFEGDGSLLIAVPIQVEGPTSELQMAGRVNFKREDLNLTLVATLPVGNNLALVAALAGGLPAAAGVYLISKAFKKQVSKMASVSYRISGDWSEPEIRFDKLFDGDGAERQGAAAGMQRPSRKQRKPAPEAPLPEEDDEPAMSGPGTPAPRLKEDGGAGSSAI
ncbi:YhdP family protein [Microbulbifer yueqingensis]|uniref:TIGR02099 family protein n=1 Tax=Microbulbifer yueqingensis TaxID=658219 RepID=A0A1G8VJ66_9GAMM|nr:AsmA-like C-terminal region-containing protein [Microbulbifer yueqingensis]SDJ65964.1 TIGR02099 family protein [Microbulbifer yueqingensis]